MGRKFSKEDIEKKKQGCAYCGSTERYEYIHPYVATISNSQVSLRWLHAIPVGNNTEPCSLLWYGRYRFWRKHNKKEAAEAAPSVTGNEPVGY